ncbi:hypothetical protein BRYFOR_08027 [Marvinbryantia formatexigens DSM 14469]|uniref:Uncharacterized protein n=1 Tax=Marvinbryantia formatexigens DSM 14469 TaxID=478749 RepID=C6LHB6_9FIRM|nr:hypothetical protein BRYFOR_08027 [Marvinbryantia formatexigens DSM 14469]
MLYHINTSACRFIAGIFNFLEKFSAGWQTAVWSFADCRTFFTEKFHLCGECLGTGGNAAVCGG